MYLWFSVNSRFLREFPVVLPFLHPYAKRRSALYVPCHTKWLVAQGSQGPFVLQCTHHSFCSMDQIWTWKIEWSENMMNMKITIENGCDDVVVHQTTGLTHCRLMHVRSLRTAASRSANPNGTHHHSHKALVDNHPNHWLNSAQQFDQTICSILDSKTFDFGPEIHTMPPVLGAQLLRRTSSSSCVGICIQLWPHHRKKNLSHSRFIVAF